MPTPTTNSADDSESIVVGADSLQTENPMDLSEDRGNSLGSFLRSRRRSLGWTLSELAAKINYSLSLISKAELNQLPEGPTLKMLERLADVLQTDIVHLVELKQQDAQFRQELQTLNDDTEQVRTQWEQRMLSLFRMLDRHAQQHLVEEAQFIHSLRATGRSFSAAASPAKGQSSAVSFASSDSYAASLNALPEQVASDWEKIAKVYDTRKRHEEAISFYETARDIYEQAGRLGAAGRTWFMQGKILNHLARYDENQNAEQLQLSRLEDADFCFQRAGQLFSQARSSETEANFRDDEKQFVPENLRQWAMNDAHMGRVRFREKNAATGYDVDPAYYDAVLRHYQGRGHAKRQESAVEFTRWVEELQAKLREEASNVEFFPRRNLLDILERSLHRKGLLHSNISSENIRFLKALSTKADTSLELKASESKAATTRRREEKALMQEAAEHSRLFRASFLQAIHVRREMVWTAATQAERDENINRLANDHQALAYAVQNHTQPTEPPAQHEEALYNYLLARNIDMLLPADYDPGQTKDIGLLLQTIEQDNALSAEMQAAIRHRVEDRLKGANLGTREEPVLDYDAQYFPYKAPS